MRTEQDIEFHAFFTRRRRSHNKLFKLQTLTTMKSKIPNVDMGAEIRKYLNEQKRTVTWLADEIDYDQSNLNKQMNNKHIHPVLLFKIAQALKTDLFGCYSRLLTESNDKR